MPTIVSLDPSPIDESAFTLNCTSTSSPATTVIWSKNSRLLTTNETYQMTQILQDGSSSTYDNLLTILSSPTDLLGTYRCTVVNSLGSSNYPITIQGMPILCSSTMQLYSLNVQQCSHIYRNMHAA